MGHLQVCLKNCIVNWNFSTNISSEGWVTALCTFVPWSWRHRNSVSLPIIKNFFQILRTENPDLKIGAAGFCWGGRYAILAAQKTFNDPPLVDAVFAGHPSMLSIPADVSHPIRPISIAVASIDNWYPPKTAKKTEELWKPFEDIKTQFVIYEDAKHGFCVRGNMNNPKEKENMEKAIDQVSFALDKIKIFRLLTGSTSILHNEILTVTPLEVITVWNQRSANDCLREIYC